jgi:MoCo/4Fe-4S cofactor protein with predicted Tat translocation signal
MKTIPPQCPEPETVKYWKSIEQLENSPEVRPWLEREFPEGASEATQTDRRNFLKVMSASLALAGVGVMGAGCRRPEQRIYPFSKLPDDYVHGAAKYYATAMPTRAGAVPLLVKSDDGRPTKIEGNPDHPDSNGGTDLFAQASLLSLYDPDRAQRFARGGNDVSRQAALDELNAIGQRFSGNGGQGLAFLLERSTSPSRLRLQQAIAQKMPQARWFIHEPVDFDIHRQAASAVAGRSVTPYFRYAQAKAILSLDCDFIGAESETHLHCRDFARSRRVQNGTMSRLYMVEPLMSQTGMNADHRLRVSASQVAAIAAAIATRLGVQGVNANLPLPAGVSPKWIEACADDLKANGANALVVAGYRQPLAVHLIAHAINAALGANGQTVQFRETPSLNEGNLVQLAQALNGGQVDTLVILGSNPLLTAPADLNWAVTQRKAKAVVRLGYYEDETFAVTDLHLPAAHYLESWGDVRTADGTAVIVQPLIQPLFGGITELEVLARIGGLPENDPYRITRTTFGANEEAWKLALHNGFIANSASQPVNVQFNAGALAQALANLRVTAPSKDNLEVVFTRDYHVDDGRWTNNAWLVEMPNPVTKMTWDNAVLISRKTAEELGLKNQQFIDIAVNGQTVRAPIWVQPGQADYVLGLSLGWGRKKLGRIASFDGKPVGFDFYPLRTSANPNFGVGAKVAAQPGDLYKFACTQDHWSMEGRPIIREANLEQYKKDQNVVAKFDFEKPPGGNESIYQNPLDWKRDATHQWGMAIDLNTCVGCNACVIACQSENNVPVVGKDQVRRGREMHWLRIDRYYSGIPEIQTKKGAGEKNTLNNDYDQWKEHWIDDPQVVNQPMLCQHCEAAPCENVCPVNATVHDQEGLNLMVYNRCVGTRYCSNNCPWKVRRFNYFDYNKRPLENLYKPNITGWEPTKKRDEWELMQLVRNPDVTVRMRGVMEKCTFCVQRIEAAKIGQKVKAGQSGDIAVPDRTIKTACEQSCPADAIVFGNINDPKSRVSQAKADTRNYTTLEFLHTKPRLTYLARLRNPNPAMPDFYDMPLTSKEFHTKAGTDDLAHGDKGAHSPTGEKATAGEKKGAH